MTAKLLGKVGQKNQTYVIQLHDFNEDSHEAVVEGRRFNKEAVEIAVSAFVKDPSYHGIYGFYEKEVRSLEDQRFSIPALVFRDVEYSDGLLVAFATLVGPRAALVELILERALATEKLSLPIQMQWGLSSPYGSQDLVLCRFAMALD